MNISRLRGIGLCVLLASSACLAQPGAPANVQAVNDPEEPRGTQVILSWEAPDAAPEDAEHLLGYHAQFAEGNGELEWQSGAMVGAETLQTTMSGLKPWPWPVYHVRVGAIYADEDVALAEAIDPLTGGVDEEQAKLVFSEVVGPVRPEGAWFNAEYVNVLVLSLLISVIVIGTIYWVRGRVEDVYIRPIAGLEAVNDAIGRATEMGKPIVYVSGLSGIGDIATIASMLILGHLSRRSAAYETEILVPCNDPLVMTTEREIVRQAYTEAGKPDAYQPDNIFFVTDSQFGYVAAVDGIMIREEPAACFYMGYFYAEALILAETGNETGAIQIAGTDADTQLPFFITACDYTLMGEELYAASAYLSRQPLLVAQLRGQDVAKTIIVAVMIAGVAAATCAAVSTGWLADAAQAFVQWFAT